MCVYIYTYTYIYTCMCGSRWVITPLWLSRSLRSFCTVLLCILTTSSEYHLLLLGPYCSVLYCNHCAWNVPLLSLIFLKRSLIFPIRLFSSIALYWLVRKAFLSLLAILGTLHSNGYIFPFLLCLSLLFFSQLFVRPPQTTILPFCISSSWGQFWSLPPVQC